MTPHPALQRLFRGWEDAGAVWVCLRPPEDPARPEGDLDILLERRTARTAELVARTFGFVRVPGRRHGLHLLQYDAPSRQWLWLHCTTQLAFGPYRAVRPGLENWWLTQRTTCDDMAVLPPALEFWVTLLHALLDKGVVTPRSRRRLAAAAPEAAAEGPLAEAITELLPAGWTPADLLEAVRRGDWDSLELLVSGLRARAHRRAAGPLALRAWRRVARAARELRSVRRARGVRVALLGPDGAGKTTLAQGLERSFPFPVRQVYMGLTGGWLRHVDRLRVPGVVRAGRVLVIWGRYLRGQFHAHRGRLVVFDRYIYDAEVPTPFPLSRWGRWARWMDGRVCPGPDLVLLLDAPGAVMHQRKGEYDPATLEDWRQRFLGIRRRHPNVQVLDTSRPPEAVLADATEQIWRCYAARWSRG